VDVLADLFVTETAARHPELATYLGVPGFDDRWSDYSPDGMATDAEHQRTTIAALAAVDPSDDREIAARDAMLERLGLGVELYDAHITASRVSVIAGTAQEVRETFDLMPTDGASADETEECWRNIATRLATVGTPLEQSRQTLLAEADQGRVSAVRQISGTAEQIMGWTGRTGDDDFFAGLVARAPESLSQGLRADLNRAADTARAAFAGYGEWLTTELAPKAPTRDAVGVDRYALESRFFLGARIDLAETYAWGWAELHRLQEQQRAIATELYGHTDIKQACTALDDDPARQVHGAEAFRDWMQQLADRAVSELAGSQFDIPEPIRAIECCLAPTHDGGIYYTGPTEDFSRPGRMWWSVPEGIETFSTWSETTTVYHEGVPGHHLQVAQNAYRADLLNRWQRQLCWVSGHGEGWALYAERLMDDLGYLSDPGDRMGMLDSQVFRAIRVIIDIGLHLELTLPEDNPLGFAPGATWTPDLALQLLLAHTSINEPTLRFEVDRYLGWPGQAPSYKVGERIWLAARDEVRQRKGAAFDLKQFHADALNLGSIGLDPLRQALARL